MITLQRLVVAHYKGIQALDLTFPERGSFLIEGRNEAGKSTLFDAVHFALYGVPMVGDQASALHYGAEQMEVRLQLTVSGTRLAVWRRTRQTAKTLRSEAELTVVRPGIGSQADGPEEGDEETVRGAAAVSQRLQVELGGLTAEALLNSCLVAQKQLGRLETLSRASREDALTILLNLGKLSDVQARLKLRPQDDVQLNVTRARVTWARATGEREVLAEDRRALETQRRYVQLQHGLAQLDALHAAGVTARMTLAGLQERLALLRAELTGIQSLKATQARWQRVQDVAQQTAAARRECIDLERRAAEARRAATDLPEEAGALERHQAARARAEALAGQQTRLKEIAQERERIAARVQERARLVALSTRLTAEIDRRRRERRDVATQINLLAPLLTEQQGLAARLAALQKLQQRVSGLGEVRRTLEDLESQVAERAEAEARYRAAEATLDAARAALAIQEALRRQRELCGALRRWREARLAADAATRARRLLEDLALAVAGVEHVTVRPETVLHETGEPDAPEGAEAPGLRLSLLVDHPLTGAQVLRLRLWGGGAELVEARPASTAEATGLQAGNLPLLSASGDATPVAELQEATAALTAHDEPAPEDAAAAERRLAAVEATLAAATPAAATLNGVGDVAPDDQGYVQGYVQARAEVIAAEQRRAEARAACAELPPMSMLKSHIVAAQGDVATTERACRTMAQELGLPPLGLPEAIPGAIAAAQLRHGELAEATGQRTGLQARLVDIDRAGGEWLRQIEEARQDLATDSEAALRSALELLAAEQNAGETEAVRLYASLAPVVARTAGASSAERKSASESTVVAVATRDSAAGTATTVTLVDVAIPVDLPVDLPVNGTASGIPAVDVAALRWRLQQECDALQGQVAVLERQAAVLEEAEAGRHEAGERLAALGRALDGAVSDAAPPSSFDGPLANAAPASPPDSHLTERSRLRPNDDSWSGDDTSEIEARRATAPEAVLAFAQRRYGAIDAQIAALDEPAVRDAEQAAQHAVWAARAGLAHTVEEGWRLADQLRSLADEAFSPAFDVVSLSTANPGQLGRAPAVTEPDGARNLDGLAGVAAALRAAGLEAVGDLPDLGEIEGALDGLRQREWSLTREVQDAALLLGDETLGDDTPPSLAEATVALAELELDHTARRRAQDILGQTRQRMINKVLPDTMRNMCLLLPLLTAERYRYAELTPDYRLQVWDERKHGYVEKSLYSGGTQDQFSLALRLGFALAALPRELGTSPGFLFLDEPLSSFDRDRTAALIDLLTHGQIATFFQQVFLISHSQAFDPSLFTHHIVMENGAVAHSTLPVGSS